jgi:hypothetical protein
MIQTDQRRNLRFTLRLPMELVRTGSAQLRRVTETRNVSSGGVLFSSDAQLPVGEPIEYFITLPSGNDTNGVRLHCVGTVIRLESRPPKSSRDRDRPFNVAATMERYEFVRQGR